MDWAKKWLLDFSAGKTQLVSFDRSNNTGSIDVKMDGSVLEEISYFQMLELIFSSKLDCGSYIIAFFKTASRKIWALVRSMKIFPPEIAPYLYKSTILPCMEYCCHAWAGAPNCSLELLEKLQNRICRTVGPWLIVEMWPAYVFSICITLVDVLQNWLNWFHFLFLEVGLLVILIDCKILWLPILNVTRMSMSTVSLLAQLDSRIVYL